MLIIVPRLLQWRNFIIIKIWNCTLNVRLTFEFDIFLFFIQYFFYHLQFSKRVPRFEHSVALKLSCVGRDKKHELEQDYFRTAFPQTPLVGCYGDGEIGINHPARNCSNVLMAKRPRRDPFKDMTYSYSTVFVYMGWGKIVAPPESPD